jgi:tRNA(Ile)-lysidine synthase
MESSLIKHVEQSIRCRRLFSRRQPILVAVSGGLDSMVLLQLLSRLATVWHWPLTVAHFNHQLRGAASDADERLVQTTAERLGLPVVVGRADVRAFQVKEKLSIEMAARQLRHGFLAATAQARHIHRVALAHHADDQVELFLLRLLRGAGGTGLAGMAWTALMPGQSSCRLVRPLLDLPKSVLAEFARAHGIVFREDASNASLAVPRNRIRHELLPLLERYYQPAVRETLLRAMDILSAENQWVAAQTIRWRQQDRQPAFARLALALQRQAMQQELEALGVEPSFDLIEQLRGPTHRAVTIREGLAVERDETGRVALKTTVAPAFNENQRTVSLRQVRGEVIFDGCRLQWHFQPPPARPPHTARPGCEWFDAGRVGRPIRLRHWRPGDRFQPIGMKTAVKLQDLFINRKIPRADRHRLVVAETRDGRVFWVEGLRLAEGFKLDKVTVRGLKWCWHRE